MNQPDLEFLTVGEGAEARDIAYYYRPALDDSLDIVEPPEADMAETYMGDAMAEEAPNVTGLVWLGGFKSDMTGSKAAALDAYADIRGLSLLRFDYSGHGASKGEFLDGTISRWLEEAAAIVEHTSQFGDRLVLAGSSMGGWIALLLNELMKAKDDTANPDIDITGDIAGLDIGSIAPPSVAGLVLVAPATDMTQDLMWAGMSEAERAQMQTNGQFARPNDYSDEPYIITKKLIDDGKKHLFGNAIIHTQCPVHILQGSKDNSVPPAHALKLASQLPLDDVVVSITPDGDHSLSRPQDLDRLIQTIDGMLYSS